MHPSLLEITTGLAVESGLLILLVHEGEPGSLAATVEGKKIIVGEDVASNENDVGDGGGSSAWSRLNKAVVAVHQLLYEAGIFIASEKAGL